MPTTPAYQSESAFDAAIDGGAGINNSRSAASITAGEVNALLKNVFRSFDVAIDKSDAASAGVAVQINAARDGLELVPATRRLPDVPTGSGQRGILKTVEGGVPTYADIEDADLARDILEQLVNSFALTISGGEVRIIMTDGDGGTARDERASLPTANADNAGIVQLHGDIGENDTNDSQAVTARKVNERINGRILRGTREERQALVGQVLEVDSQGAVVTGAKGTGPKGDKGDPGDPGGQGNPGNPGAPGASASIYAVRYYQTNNSATPPAAPTSASDANWATSLTAPSASARYAWQAIGVGNGTLSAFADVDAWLILPAGVFASTSGGSTPPPAQNHALYLAYAPSGGAYTFTAADATAAGRSVNNSADETSGTLVLPSIPSGEYREVGIYMPTNKRLARLEVGDTNTDQSGGFTLQQATVTIPPSTAYVVYESNQPQGNPTPDTVEKRTYRITTRDA